MQLLLSLLGPYEASLDGRPIGDLYSSKVRGLLAYLAVEAGRPHARTVLAALLWPDWSDRAALGNLRFSLSKLRQAIHDQDADPPFLSISRDTIEVDRRADFRADVRSFEEHIAASHWQQAAAYKPGEAEVRRDAILCSIGHLEAAVGLYRGPFLEGFSCGDSAAFEEWALLTRERIEQRLISAIRVLVTLHRRLGDLVAAERYCRRLLALDAWDEEANAALMTVLAEAGHRNAALRHYAAFQAELAKELGAEPSEETTALYEQILDRDEHDRASVPRPLARTLPWGTAQPLDLHTSSLIAREAQLEQLDGYLDEVLAGRGCAAFISGEAGSGKTALMQEFARHAMGRCADLLVAVGRCNAFTGIGDPYLPFREISRMLIGDTGSTGAANELSAEHARRLKSALPVTTRALLEAGPDLADLFVGATSHAQILGAASASKQHPLPDAWQDRLQELKGRRGRLRQLDLFSQYTSFLLAVAARRPLVLYLDDLQWADNASISLLFHLGRRLAGSKILIVGAYRPEELLSGPDGSHRPLVAVINELRRTFGEVEIDLDQADGRHFVSALLDMEPNRLEQPFRETLYRRTGGRPLFTIELLHGLRDRGELVRDGTGAWIEGKTVDWERLPPRVGAVIAERVGRIPPDATRLLAAASVEGDEFTAEVVAQVLDLEKIAVLRQFAGVLAGRHGLVRGCGAIWPEDSAEPLSRYRFRHFLYHTYLYENLDPAEQARLHGLTGEALERLYGAKSRDMAVSLARHFERAGSVSRAVDYLQAAGDQAMRLAAYEEAVTHLTHGLALLATTPRTPDQARRELRLRLSLAGPLTLLHSFTDAIRMDTVAPTSALSRDAGGVQAVHALFVEAIACRDRCDYPRALALGRRMLDMAQASGEREAALLAHCILGSSAVFAGEAVQGRAGLEAGLRLYSVGEDDWLATLAGPDLKAFMLSLLGLALWCLGYPDQAATARRSAIERAEQLDQPATLAIVLALSISYSLLMRTGEDVRLEIETLHRLLDEKKTAIVSPWSSVFDGWLAAHQGGAIEGAARMRAGLTARGRQIGSATLLAIVARMCLDQSLVDEGLQAVDDALGMIAGGLGNSAEAELVRLKGALMLARSGPGDGAAAEACFSRAIDIARGQQAHSWELRASVDLARLWQQQGKVREARELLAGIYGWFTEGFDSHDLIQARAVLDALSKRC